MKKTIEITPVTALGMVSAAGFYELAGSLYVAMGSNVIPMYIGLTSQLVESVADAAVGGGISEATLLKAIAISQRPELAQQLTV